MSDSEVNVEKGGDRLAARLEVLGTVLLAELSSFARVVARVHTLVLVDGAGKLD